LNTLSRAALRLIADSLFFSLAAILAQEGQLFFGHREAPVAASNLPCNVLVVLGWNCRGRWFFFCFFTPKLARTLHKMSCDRNAHVPKIFKMNNVLLLNTQNSCLHG